MMGILNVTPDSFSDGGKFIDQDAAISHGQALVAQGVDIIDVGGESTRPGSSPVPPAEQCRRVIPVIEHLSASAGVPISVDTQSAQVADAALTAGAQVVNDVSAGRNDPEILNVVAQHEAGYVVMHMQGDPTSMQDRPHYDDVVAEVIDFLRRRSGLAHAAGIAPWAIAADPGIGFGKTRDHNFVLLAHISRIVDEVDAPVLVGTSRKGFLRLPSASSEPDGGSSSDFAARDDATLATIVWSLNAGVQIVRVHLPIAALRARSLLEAMAD